CRPSRPTSIDCRAADVPWTWCRARKNSPLFPKRGLMTIRRSLHIVTISFLLLGWIRPAFTQSISSGTVTGTVMDQSGAVVPGATIEIRNDISRYQQTTVTDSSGSFRFNNVPFNPYLLTVTLSGFKTVTQNLAIRSTVPQDVKLTMAV